MKQILLTGLLIFSLSVFGQNQIKIYESPRLMSKSTQNAFIVEIPQANLKQVKQDWLKYLSNGSKGKATEVNGENLQIGVVNKNISPNPFNVYSTLLETTEGVKLTVWFTENEYTFFSKELNSDQDLAVLKYLNDFAIQELEYTVQNELKIEQDKEKGLEKELDKFIKDEESAVKKIADYQRSIQLANDAIGTNNQDIELTSYKITEQKEMVDRTSSDPNATKGAKKTLKSLEAKKKSLQNQNETESKNIDKWYKEIRAEERNIADAKEHQALKIPDIEKQKQKVQDVQLELSNIQ